MRREYIRGSKEHWNEVCEYVYGVKANSGSGICGNDKAIFVKNEVGGFTLYTDPITCDAITTNPNWHEVKPWENKPHEPKPFDKVLGWNYNENAVFPDIFLYKDLSGPYICAGGFYKHIKPYNEEEYKERTE